MSEVRVKKQSLSPCIELFVARSCTSISALTTRALPPSSFFGTRNELRGVNLTVSLSDYIKMKLLHSQVSNLSRSRVSLKKTRRLTALLDQKQLKPSSIDQLSH